MVPRLRGNIRFKAARVPYTTPRYVTSVTRLYSSACISFAGEKTEAIALFTQMSIGPNSCSTDAAAFSTASASATSSGRVIALPPADSISRFAASSPSTPRAIKPTLAPCFPNSRAVARPKPADAPVITTTSVFFIFPTYDPSSRALAYSNKLAHLIGERGQRNFLSVGLPTCQGLGKVQRLLGFDLRGHWRLERIDNGLQDGRSRSREKLLECSSAIFWILDAEADTAAGMGESRKIDRVQIDTVLRISQKNHLLPLDLPQRIVLDDDHFDWELVLHGGDEVSHQHGEPAVSDESDALTIREGNLRGNRIGQPWRHRRQVPGKGMHLTATGQNVTSPPGCDRSAIAAHNRIAS